MRYELAEVPPIPFEDVVEKVCASLEWCGSGWYDEELSVGEAGPGTAVPEEVQIAELIAHIRCCENFDQLFALLDAPHEYVGAAR